MGRIQIEVGSGIALAGGLCTHRPCRQISSTTWNPPLANVIPCGSPIVRIQIEVGSGIALAGGLCTHRPCRQISSTTWNPPLANVIPPGLPLPERRSKLPPAGKPPGPIMTVTETRHWSSCSPYRILRYTGSTQAP